MKKRVIQFLTLCLVTTFTFSFSAGQTIPGIHLGRLEFVRPPEGLSNDMRGLMETMSKTKGITSSFASKVGGVAFVQVAQPSFKVESFSLQCDPIKNSAYAIINGQRYDIPLETWQLMPIVAYANSVYVAAVSLYGRRIEDGKCRIVFHKAFIDNLLGIRLLQADILLAGFMQPKYRVSLPTFDGDDIPILGNSEYALYNPDEDSLPSLEASKLIHGIDSLVQNDTYSNSLFTSQWHYSTYVFTDFNDSEADNLIKFNIIDSCLTIDGFPYFYFIKNTKQIDTIDFLVDFFDKIKESKAFNKKASPKSFKIRRKIKNSNYKKALELFCEFYDDISDSTTALAKYNLKGIKLNIIYNLHRDVPLPLSGKNRKINEKINKIIKHQTKNGDMDLNDRFLLAEYENKLTKSTQYPSFDDLLICQFYQTMIHKIEKSARFTNIMKKRRDLVRDLNPIVYDAAVATCQWSAFFRYVKENYPQNWDSFVKQVEKLQYDAPEVYTPIDIKNR